MKVLYGLLFIVISVYSSAAFAQTEEAFTLRVDPESAVIRSLPSLDAEFIASAFRDETLIAVGRNMDGMWLKVRRPGRMNNLGWISRTVVLYDFHPEVLPLTDFTTGLVGETILEADPGAAAFTLAEVNLRRLPAQGEAVTTRAPFGVILPVLERDHEGLWVNVNYLGVEGWVNAANLRGVDDVMSLPLASGLPQVPLASVLIIPLDVQLNEIQEFRDYLTEQSAFAGQLVSFWTLVIDYEMMPCEPPEFVTNYLFSQQDERAFPELEYLVPRLDTAIDFVNSAIEPMYVCGVKRTQIVRDARNAGIIYDATLAAIRNIETQITANR